jgi:hypothetical protein
MWPETVSVPSEAEKKSYMSLHKLQLAMKRGPFLFGVNGDS